MIWKIRKYRHQYCNISVWSAFNDGILSKKITKYSVVKYWEMLSNDFRKRHLFSTLIKNILIILLECTIELQKKASNIIWILEFLHYSYHYCIIYVNIIWIIEFLHYSYHYCIIYVNIIWILEFSHLYYYRIIDDWKLPLPFVRDDTSYFYNLY